MDGVSDIEQLLDEVEKQEQWTIYKNGRVIDIANCIYDACDKAIFFGFKFTVDYTTKTVVIGGD